MFSSRHLTSPVIVKHSFNPDGNRKTKTSLREIESVTDENKRSNHGNILTVYNAAWHFCEEE